MARALQLSSAKRPEGVRLVRKSQRASDGFALIDLIFVCGIIGLLCQHRAAAPAAGQAGRRRRVGDRLDARHQQRAADVRADVRQRLLRAEPDDARHAASRQHTKRSFAAALGDRRTRSPRAATSSRSKATPFPGCAGGVQRPRLRARRRQGFRAGRRSDRRRATRASSRPTPTVRSTSTRRARCSPAMPEVGEPPVGPFTPLIQL